MGRSLRQNPGRWKDAVGLRCTVRIAGRVPSNALTMAGSNEAA